MSSEQKTLYQKIRLNTVHIMSNTESTMTQLYADRIKKKETTHLNYLCHTDCTNATPLRAINGGSFGVKYLNVNTFINRLSLSQC